MKILKTKKHLLFDKEEEYTEYKEDLYAHKVKCEHCKSSFVVTKSERYKGVYIEGVVGVWYPFICPVCNRLFDARFTRWNRYYEKEEKIEDRKVEV